MIRTILLCVGLVGTLPILAAQGPTDLAGLWVTDVTQGAAPQVLLFARRGGAWVGTMTSDWGSISLSNVVYDGQRIAFNQYFNGSLTPFRPTVARGVLEGNKLLLKVEGYPDGYRDRVAHRVSASEAASVLRQTRGTPRLKDLTDNGLARLPPMGWNSWNHFALHIDDQTVREIADALVSSGLRDVGFVYVNIDDGWQGERDTQGLIHSNARFPDMTNLAEYLHTRGLRLGLYSSPGIKTCAGFTGSYRHEIQDAETYARWGIDYLKYDWCSARDLYATPGEMQAAFLKMGRALRASGRPIVYSLSQHGLFDVGRWGRQVGGNLWRTTADIQDDWAKMEEIGFGQNGREGDAGPGGWNDPDMLEVGNGGMSQDEYRTHLTLWAILSAPLLLGNDTRTMTGDTLELLANREVIAIDQDPAGMQGHRARTQGSVEIWTKPLADGSLAWAAFNRSNASSDVRVNWSDFCKGSVSKIRDIWRSTELPATTGNFSTTLPPHGTILLRLY
jgi:alpha-galactosidase